MFTIYCQSLSYRQKICLKQFKNNQPIGSNENKLSEQCWQNIKIKNTSIVGGNFYKSNLSGSEFDTVRIGRINVNRAILFNCNWENIYLDDNYKLYECRGHEGPINNICFSHDGLTFASASDDGYIKLWNLKTGKQKQKLKMKCKIQSLNFSPDKATLANGNNKGNIFFWNFRSGKIKQRLKGHNNFVNSVCFSPDGTTLASGSSDNSIRLWNVSTGELKSQLNGHSHYVTSDCFSPNGTTLPSGSYDKSIRFWDASTLIKWTQ